MNKMIDDAISILNPAIASINHSWLNSGTSVLSVRSKVAVIPVRVTRSNHFRLLLGRSFLNTKAHNPVINAGIKPLENI